MILFAEFDHHTRVGVTMSKYTTAIVDATNCMSAAQLEATQQVNLDVYQAKQQIETGGHVYYTSVIMLPYVYSQFPKK